MASFCCICWRVFVCFGNNPWPIASPKLECCDDCNRFVVTPARVRIGRAMEEAQKRAHLRAV